MSKYIYSQKVDPKDSDEKSTKRRNQYDIRKRVEYKVGDVPRYGNGYLYNFDTYDKDNKTVEEKENNKKSYSDHSNNDEVIDDKLRSEYTFDDVLKSSAMNKVEYLFDDEDEDLFLDKKHFYSNESNLPEYKPLEEKEQVINKSSKLHKDKKESKPNIKEQRETRKNQSKIKKHQRKFEKNKNKIKENQSGFIEETKYESYDEIKHLMLEPKKDKVGIFEKIKRLPFNLKHQERIKKLSKKQLKVLKFVNVISVVGFVVLAAYIAKYFIDLRDSDKINDRFINMYQSDSSQVESTTKEPETSEPEKPIMNSDFDAMFEANEDVIGVIDMIGTKIKYPVFQTYNNDFYLKHNAEKKPNVAGSLYLDYRYSYTDHSKLPDKSIIYGHNMADLSYFGSLSNFAEVDYVKKHPIIKFNTLYDKEDQYYKIFASILINRLEKDDDGPLFPYHNNLTFQKQEEFDYFYKNVMKRSYYTTGVNVKFGDKFLVLSTCGSDYVDFKESRRVVFARKVRKGESTECDINKIEPNEDVYLPIAWYKKHGKTPPR